MLTENQIANVANRLARNLLGQYDRLRFEKDGKSANPVGFNELGLQMFLARELTSIFGLAFTEAELESLRDK